MEDMIFVLAGAVVVFAIARLIIGLLFRNMSKGGKTILTIVTILVGPLVPLALLIFKKPDEDK